MNVLVVEPGMAPYEKEINGLKDMQAIVGGMITAIYPFEEKVAIVSNDEAQLLNMEFNRSIEGGYGGICGPFFVCGLGEEDFCSLTSEQMDFYKKKYHHAEILLGFRGREPVTLKVGPRKPPSQELPKHPPKTHGSMPPVTDERLAELTDRLENGIKELYASGRYAEYLAAMSKFHHYSFGNALLILLQCPTATSVAGYNDWKKKFGRQVKRYEKGIQILAPCHFTYLVEYEKKDPDTGQHSKKPEEARRRIEALMGDVPRVELFARRPAPGWDIWGNEVDSTIDWNIT